jgi:hypothetical protein
MSATGQIAELELEHPGGRVRLTVPEDVAVGELIGDFLDVAELPDSNGWSLRLAEGRPCEGALTLAQLGKPRAIVLYDSTQNGSPDATHASSSPEAPPADPEACVSGTDGRAAGGSRSPGTSAVDITATASEVDGDHVAPEKPRRGSAGAQERFAGRASRPGRPVRAKAEELLPARLGTLARVRRRSRRLAPRGMRGKRTRSASATRACSRGWRSERCGRGCARRGGGLTMSGCLRRAW